MTNEVLARQMGEPESGILLLAPLVTSSTPATRWEGYSPVFLPPLLANAMPSEVTAPNGTSVLSEERESVPSPAATGWSGVDPDVGSVDFAEPSVDPGAPIRELATTPVTADDASDPAPAIGDSSADDTVIEVECGEGPAALGAVEETTPEQAGGELRLPDGDDEGWRDELPLSALGETEPEDELPFLAADAAFPISTAEPRGARADALARPAALIERAHVEDLADRLEDIASMLREQGPARLLLGQARDPLSALITGYLVGYLESQARATTADTSASG